MEETRNIKVIKTDGTLIQVRVKSFDVARTLALVSPVSVPVVIIHKGRCLYPFMSIASQNVSDGDVVILKPIDSSLNNSKSKIKDILKSSRKPNRSKKSLYGQKNWQNDPNSGLNSCNNNFNYNVFEEVLRISDLQFSAYESSMSGGFAYQQMAEMLNFPKNNELNVQCSQIINYSKSEKVEDRPLPVIWSNIDEDEISSPSKTQVKKIPKFTDHPKIVPSSSID